jgi:hypothetical protein
MSHELEEQIARSVLKRFPGAEQAAKEIAQEALSAARAGEDVVDVPLKTMALLYLSIPEETAKVLNENDPSGATLKLVQASASLLRLPEAAPGWPKELIDGLQEQVLERRSAPSKLRGTHLDWMLDQIKQGIVVGTKAHRWFAFVQGVLAERGAIDVDLERDRTRPFLKAMLSVAPAPSAGGMALSLDTLRAAEKALSDRCAEDYYVHDGKALDEIRKTLAGNPINPAPNEFDLAVMRERDELREATPPTPSADTRDAELMKRADELCNALTKSTPAPANGEPFKNQKLNDLLQQSIARYAALSPEEKAAHDYEQKRSFAKGMCPDSQNYEDWCKRIDETMPPSKALSDTWRGG